MIMSQCRYPLDQKGYDVDLDTVRAKLETLEALIAYKNNRRGMETIQKTAKEAESNLLHMVYQCLTTKAYLELILMGATKMTAAKDVVKQFFGSNASDHKATMIRE